MASDDTGVPGAPLPRSGPQGTRLRGRLAPSPTGMLHLGNAFAFLCAWLGVRSRGGALVLRMEDLDPERSQERYADAIMRDLAWLGLDWDEGPDAGGSAGPYVQSLRQETYRAALADFERRALAYPCFCTRKELRTLAGAPHVGDEGAPYPGTCRDLSPDARRCKQAGGKRPSLRLHTGRALRALGSGHQEALRFFDLVREEWRCPQGSGQGGMPGGDFALRRSDAVVAYQLAVACDDAAMGITQVTRGEDLLPSTPRQVLLLRLWGHEPPAYAHVPLVCDPAGERLAKRHKALELAALRAAGVRPDAVTGYLAWLAGLQGDRPEPRAAAPADLARTFSFSKLAGRRLVLPQDVTSILKRL